MKSSIVALSRQINFFSPPLWVITVHAVFVALALATSGCGGGTQSMSDAGTSDVATGSDAGSNDTGPNACPSGMPANGTCNVVTNAGCRAGETCVLYQDLDRTITTSCMTAGRAGPGQSCSGLADCGPGFGCYGGVCSKMCCGAGDDATCQTGTGAMPGAVCAETIQGADARICYVPADAGSGCDSDRALCGGQCVLLNQDVRNCGACGHACGAGENCFDGVCCPDVVGETQCGGACVNTRNDSNNCGRCGQTCAANEICRHDGSQPGDGSCTPAGAPCATDNDCGNIASIQLECHPASLGYPGGQCGSVDYLDCDYDLDCRAGYLCRYGLCRPDCSLNPALVCGEDVCHEPEDLCGVPGTENGSFVSGGCFVDTDCSPGSTCTGPERSNLTRTCECTAQTDCGPGRACFYVNALVGSTCGCTSDAICGAGHHCNSDHACVFGTLQ